MHLEGQAVLTHPGAVVPRGARQRGEAVEGVPPVASAPAAAPEHPAAMATHAQKCPRTAAAAMDGVQADAAATHHLPANKTSHRCLQQ
jgi:hypothetical protein